MRFQQSAIGVALLVTSSMPAYAQTVQSATGPAAPAAKTAPETGTGEIVVTAERRQSTLIKAPLAVTAIDGNALARTGATSSNEVLQGVPGVVTQGVDQTNQGEAPRIAIRGLGADGQQTQAAVNIYEDGVLVAASHSFFYDLSRVEVLRGPQGTLYGQGATGGAVNVIHNDPKLNAQSFDGQVEAGNYGTIHSTFAANTGGDDVAFRIAVNQDKHDGYNPQGYGDENAVNARATMLFKPSSNFSALVGGNYFREKVQGDIETLVARDGSIKSDLSQPDPDGGFKSNSYYRFFANVHLDVGPVDLTYIPAYQHNTLKVDQYGGPGLETGGKTDGQQTHEFRVSSNGTSKLSWVVGAYYLRDHSDNIFHAAFATDFVNKIYSPFLINNEQVNTSSGLALFGEFTYSILPSVRITGGIRRQHTNVHYIETDPGPIPAPAFYDVTLKYNKINYRARVDADVGSDGLLYASVSTGARPGGVGTYGVRFGPESVTAYEAGYKARLFDNRLQLALAGYYYDYGGFQTPIPVLDPNNSSAIIGYGVSVLPAKFYGAELELTYRLTRDDRVTFTPAWEHGRFGANYLNSDGVTTVYSDGKAPPHVPAWSLAGSYTHIFRIDNGAQVELSGSGKYQSKQFNGLDSSIYGTSADPAGTVVPNPSYVTKRYALFDAQLTYRAPRDRFSLGAYVRNLSNVHYKLNVLPGSTPGLLSARPNDPRTFGVIGAVHF